MALGLRARQAAFVYHGQKIGVRGVLPRAMPRKAFRERVQQVVGNEVRTLDFGRPLVRTVGIVSGGGPSQIAEAIEMGLDVYLTGEVKPARVQLGSTGTNQRGLLPDITPRRNSACKPWVRKIRTKFGLPVAFVDMGIPY